MAIRKVLSPRAWIRPAIWPIVPTFFRRCRGLLSSALRVPNRRQPRFSTESLRKGLAGWAGGTIWAIPVLLLLVALTPSVTGSLFALSTLLAALSAQALPYATVPEATRSARLARQGKWAQAQFYNILAQHKLRRSPWKAGIRLFRTPFEAPTLALSLRADSARFLLSMGQFREAERVLRGLLADLPGHAPSLHNLALALHAQGRLGPASEALRAAVDRGYVQPAPEILGKVFVYRLGFPVRLSFREKRIAFYQSLGFHDIALSCASFGDELDTPWRRTVSLLALNRPLQARGEVLCELGRRPDNPFAWLAHGFLCAQEGLNHEASSAYKRALRQTPPELGSLKNQLCQEHLYQLCARGGDRKTLQDALAVLEEHESDPRARAMGRALLMGALGRSRKALEEIAAAGPLARTPSLLELAGYIHLQLGHVDEGCRLLRRFRIQALTSRLPMLDRQARLNRALESVLRHRRHLRRGAAQDSRS